MLSNAYFLAKFRFDTAENEPAKNLQTLKIFPILLTDMLTAMDLVMKLSGAHRRAARGPERRGAVRLAAEPLRRSAGRRLRAGLGLS